MGAVLKTAQRYHVLAAAALQSQDGPMLVGVWRLEKGGLYFGWGITNPVPSRQPGAVLGRWQDLDMSN